MLRARRKPCCGRPTSTPPRNNVQVADPKRIEAVDRLNPLTGTEPTRANWSRTCYRPPDANLLAERLGIKVDYAGWLLTHARKMKRGIIRVVVSEKNDGLETANNQAHHYRYVLDDDLTPETRHYVEVVIAKFRTVNPDIHLKAANAQGAHDSHELEVKSEPAPCTNPDVNGPGRITVANAHNVGRPDPHWETALSAYRHLAGPPRTARGRSSIQWSIRLQRRRAHRGMGRSSGTGRWHPPSNPGPRRSHQWRCPESHR
jgi:hypothetical protein